MKVLLGLIVTVMMTINTATAAPFTDELSKCLVNYTSVQDRETLIEWIHAAMSSHPIVKSKQYDSSEVERINQKTAKLVDGLITQKCEKEAKEAIKYEGDIAIQKAFGALGKVAIKGLMDHRDVVDFMQSFVNYMDVAGLAKVYRPENSRYMKAKKNLEDAILKSPMFPARPVWWSDDRVLALGIVDTDEQFIKEASEEACSILLKHGFQNMTVEIYDVVKIQKSGDWVMLTRMGC